MFPKVKYMYSVAQYMFPKTKYMYSTANLQIGHGAISVFQKHNPGNLRQAAGSLPPQSGKRSIP
jgi:hypothetical protein